MKYCKYCGSSFPHFQFKDGCEWLGDSRTRKEIMDENEKLKQKIIEAVSAISTDRCDGDSHYALGVNAAVTRHTEMLKRIF